MNPLIHFGRNLLTIGILIAALAGYAIAQTPAATLDQAQKLLNTGKKAEALATVNQYLQAKPNDAQVRFFKGVVLTESGQAEEAIKLYTELIRDYPELPEPYNNLAVLYSAQNQPDLAKSALEAALRNHPGYATAHENLGDVYLQLARRSYAKAIELAPEKSSIVKSKLLRTEAALNSTAK
jgi:Flp pilus assembly protein TadD